MNFDIIVIGAGASGLMTARTAAMQGKSVLILEQMEKCGKKILATGNGKCNFTNESMQKDAFFGNEKLIENVLSHFSKDDCLSFFHEIGIYPKCKNGYYYPTSEQASSVTTAFEQELKRLSIKTMYSVCVQKIIPKKNGFELKTADTTFFWKKSGNCLRAFGFPKSWKQWLAFFRYQGAWSSLFANFTSTMCILCQRFAL